MLKSQVRTNICPEPAFYRYNEFFMVLDFKVNK